MSEYAPWWLIAWRLLWFGPLQATRVAMFLVAIIGWGRSTAQEFWEYTR